MRTASTSRGGRHNRRVPELASRVVVAVALAVDAVVHLRLASGYQQSAPGGIGAGTLFRVEATAAVVVALWVLWRGSRGAYAAALLTGLSALAAVVLYRYVDVPAVGPIPAMYEPVWFFQKSLSAVAEGAAAAVSAGLVFTFRARK